MARAGLDDRAPHTRGALSLLFDPFVTGLNALGSLLIVALVILINIEAFSRTVLNAPFEGVIELIEIGIVAIVFLQLGDATRRGVLTRSDGLFNRLMAQRPQVGRALGAVIELLGVVFMGLVLWGSLPLLAESWTEGHYVGVQHVFTAPTWPVKLVIVIGCVVTLLQFLIVAARYLRLLARGTGAPPAHG
jgi:TRAP-type C4-dicarboxylate transport system permease small subunit